MTDPHYFGGKGDRHVEMGNMLDNISKSPRISLGRTASPPPSITKLQPEPQTLSTTLM